jgi:hypothetical protein
MSIFNRSGKYYVKHHFRKKEKKHKNYKNMVGLRKNLEFHKK